MNRIDFAPGLVLVRGKTTGKPILQYLNLGSKIADQRPKKKLRGHGMGAREQRGAWGVQQRKWCMSLSEIEPGYRPLTMLIGNRHSRSPGPPE